METIFRKIVKHKNSIIFAFGISLILCFISSKFVSVNYDMNDYLPDDSKSTISLDIMQDEFKGGIPNARIMISNLTIPEALEMKDKLLNIDGVDEVTWLDDVVNITEPIETLDSSIVKDYYKEGSALFRVTINENKRIEAVNDIRDLIGEDNAMAGTAVNTATATEATSKEVSRIILFIIPICLIVLALTTTSWFEPILFMITIGVAILLNQGTNILFGEISFVTNAAGNVLQLAVSMDYAIFLLHRFAEFRENGLNPEEAMVQASVKSVTSILSSGITTVIGFAALILMRFKIGPDMGIVMAKAISLSLLTVLVLLPVLTLYCYKIIDKTEHKLLIPKFDRFSKLVKRIMIPLVVIFSIVIVPSYLAQTKNSFDYGSSRIFNENTKLGSDTKLIEDTFGKSNTLVLMVIKGDFTTEKELSNEIKEIPEVSSIISYVDNAGVEIPTEYVDESILSELISDNYSRMVINVKADYEGEETFNIVKKVRDIVAKYYSNSYFLAGESVSTYDLMDTITADNIRVNLIAIGAVFLVLLIAFKSLLIPVILVLSIETAIWINLGVPYFIDETLHYIAYLIISTVQLGATVDYAILLTNSYVENRRDYFKKEALLKTISSVTLSILTSAIILSLAGLLLGMISTHGIIKQLGSLLAKGTVLSTTIVLFVVPGLLYILDKPIQKTMYKPEFKNIKEKNQNIKIVNEIVNN